MKNLNIRIILNQKSTASEALSDPECVTCELDTEEFHCGWVEIRRNCNDCNEMLFIANCKGFTAPQSYRTPSGQDFSEKIEWELFESNSKLTEKLEEKNVPLPEFGIWKNPKFNTAHNYEVYKPRDFDTSGAKKYAVMLEVYAGIEFQKIQHKYKGYSGSHWPQVHLPGPV